MPAWLAPVLNAIAPVAIGLLSAGGAKKQNEANARMAREQMDFQREMSNTAAQRSVEDYRKAGLNPGLAYERTASTPGGAAATMGDPIGAGINAYQSAKALKQQMEIAKEQSDLDRRVKIETASATKAMQLKTNQETGLIQRQIAAAEQAIRFAETNQPWNTRLAMAQAKLAELEIPGAENSAKFESAIGAAGKGLNSARTAAEILKLLNPRSFRR